MCLCESVKAHLITGFSLQSQQHTYRTISAVSLYHVSLGCSLISSVWLSLYRRVKAALKAWERQRFRLMKSFSDYCFIHDGCGGKRAAVRNSQFHFTGAIRGKAGHSSQTLIFGDEAVFVRSLKIVCAKRKWLTIRSWWNLCRASSCPPPSSELSGEIPGAWTHFRAGGAA